MQYVNIAVVTACKYRYCYVYKSIATLATVCKHQYYHCGVYLCTNVVTATCKCALLCSITMTGVNYNIILCKSICHYL